MRKKPFTEVYLNLQIGTRIRRCRRTRNMSLADLGTAIGVSFQQVQKLEYGTNQITAARLFLIARALNVPPSYFLEFLACPNSPTSAEAQSKA